MKTSEILLEIKKIIDEISNFPYRAEISEFAKTSLQGLYSLAGDGTALIFPDVTKYSYLQSYIDTTIPNKLYKDTVIIISVGVKTTDNSSVEILDLIDILEENLSFKFFDNGKCQLLPEMVTENTKDASSITWKQILFRVQRKVKF